MRCYVAMPKRIKAYPKSISAAFKVTGKKDAKNLCLSLRKSVGAKSSLIFADGYYICTTLPTKDAFKLLPTICEHSERVYIGLDYTSLIQEHGLTLIESKAIEVLSL